VLHIDFTEEERQALHHERFHHPHPRVQQRMEALWLKSHNLSHVQIAELVQISEETLRSYLRAYQEGGIEKLKTLSWRGPESELAPHKNTLKGFFSTVRNNGGRRSCAVYNAAWRELLPDPRSIRTRGGRKQREEGLWDAAEELVRTEYPPRRTKAFLDTPWGVAENVWATKSSDNAPPVRTAEGRGFWSSAPCA